jgi:hypothetical protein
MLKGGDKVANKQKEYYRIKGGTGNPYEIVEERGTEALIRPAGSEDIGGFWEQKRNLVRC